MLYAYPKSERDGSHGRSIETIDRTARGPTVMNDEMFKELLESVRQAGDIT